MTKNEFYLNAMNTIGDLLRSPDCEDDGVALRTSCFDGEQFKSLARGVVNNFGATIRRYSYGDSDDDDHFVFSCGGVYCMVVLCSDRFSSDVVVEIMVRDDLLEFGESCSDRCVIDALF